MTARKPERDPRGPDPLSIRLASAATLCAFDPGGTFHHPRHGLRARSVARRVAAAAAETSVRHLGLIEHNVNIITPYEMSERIV